MDKGSQIIISADRTPTKLDRVQERIKSRLAGGLIVDIDTPDLDLKVKIINKKIEEIQNQFKENINLSEEVIHFIANETKTNIRELIGVLNRVIAFSRVHNKNLTVSDWSRNENKVPERFINFAFDRNLNRVGKFGYMLFRRGVGNCK